MSEDMIHFLKMLLNSIQNINGSIHDAFNFSKNINVQFLLDNCPTHLVHRTKMGAYLFHIYQPLEYVFFLLKGNCCVEKYKQSGAVVTDHARHPLQIFGLHESLAGISYHTATMSCITDCVCIRMPVEPFLDIIRSEPEFMWMTMQFLSCFIADYIESSDLLILNEPEFVILSKLYRDYIGQPFPVIVPYAKENLARELNLNLRTMYRYLDKFYKQGLLSSTKGKITITKEQHELIGKYLSIE